SIQHHPVDAVMSRFLVQRGEELLAALRPDRIERIAEAGETTILQAGTCRMGDDPATSVLDRDCCTHSVRNLYGVDGSFMPSIGGVPVTLTIAANAFRVAQRLIERLRRERK